MLRPGHAIALCVLSLLTIGVVMVNSAGMSIDPTRAVTIESIVLSHSTLYMVIAMSALAGASVLPVGRLSALLTGASRPPDRLAAGLPGAVQAMLSLRGLWLCVAALLAVLAFVYVPVIGKSVNGSARWVGIPTARSGFSFQPSEIAKWALLVLVAWYGTTRAHLLGGFLPGLCPALVAVGLIAGFVVIEDLGTGVLLGAAACLVLVAAGARVWHFAAFAPVAGVLFAAAVLTSEYRVKRLLSFLDPYADPEGIGYHMIQSMIAVANGKVFGRGLGHGLQKFGYLPEDRTDFLFAIICEELGVMGAAIVIALYIALIWAGVLVIRRETDRFLKLLGTGILLTVGLQAVINLAVVTGLGPTKGIALPLLSSGGTGWILTAASLGVLAAIDRGQRAWPAADQAEAPPVVVTDGARRWAGAPATAPATEPITG
ncbi:MAG TPA: putative peptidoglycan glycosyltransferase FtsW [Phycisphaerales bacterium]|nr:putative peptidoglycan glycosyltransferase FtsW [Phycisphaerales bacterium]